MAIKDGLVQHAMVMGLYGFLFKPSMVYNSSKDNAVNVRVMVSLHAEYVKAKVLYMLIQEIIERYPLAPNMTVMGDAYAQGTQKRVLLILIAETATIPRDIIIANSNI